MSAYRGAIKDLSRPGLQQHNNRLSLLSDIAGLLLLSDNPREILDNVFKSLSAHLGLEAYFNYLVTDDGSRMRLYEYGGIPADLAKEIEWLEYGQAVCGCVARDHARIVAEDVQCSTDIRTDLIRSLGITAYCCHPLIAHGKLIGTLSFGTRNRAKFKDDEIALMQTVCNLVATSLERSKLITDLKNSHSELEKKVQERTFEIRARNRMEEELRRYNRALKVITKCKEAMIHAEDETILLNDICRIIVDIGGYRMAWIGFIEDDTAKTVRPVARAGYDEGYVDSLNIALEDPIRGNGPTGISLKTGKPYGSKNVSIDRNMEPWRQEALKKGYLSTLNLPIVYEKQVAGTLAIYSDDIDAFDEEERGLLFELTQNLAYGITAMRDRVRCTRAEEDLQRANNELEERVRERTRDIIKINEALQESEERFRMLADNIPNLAWMADASGWIFWYNQRWYDYTGTTPEEMQGWGWQKVHHPDHVVKVTEEWKTRIKTGQIYDNIFPLRGKDGNYRWFLTRVIPIHDRQGKIWRWFGTNTDITDRRKIEEELNEAKHQTELYLDLMSHDINNLNQVAQGYLELANEMLEDESLRELIEKPLEAIKSSSHLIENVGMLQKAKAHELKTVRININEVLSGLQAQYSNVPDKDVTINFIQDSPCTILANGLIKDVFSNLIWNAIKHSGATSVQIDLTLSKQKEEGREYVRVTVEDNGPGIPDAVKRKLFSRFQRGDTKAHGKGLGLYLVKTLVEDYRGMVWVEDSVSGDHTMGSRFVVMLPSAES